MNPIIAAIIRWIATAITGFIILVYIIFFDFVPKIYVVQNYVAQNWVAQELAGIFMFKF